MPTNNLSPKSKNKLGIASPIPPKMSARFGSAVLPYLQSVQGLFPPTNPYGQATSNFLLGQAPQAAQQMAEGYPNVLFNTRNPLGGKRIVNPVALDMAVALPIGTALKGAGLAGGGVAATFAGIGAKTANREALLVAERMKAAGAPDEEIYKATGWFFGSADGKPRFEIPDDDARLINPAPGKLGNAYDHEELYNAYPDTQGLHYSANIDPMLFSPSGSFANGNIKVNASGIRPAESTTLHELQHAIQQREGFARGGSPEGLPEALGNDAKALRTRASQLLDQGNRPEALALEKQARQLDSQIVWGNHAPQELYRRLAGESEARLTQSRMAMTGAERAENYPPDMYDVPVGDQIVRYGEGPALATTWHGSPHKFEPTELNDLGEFNAAKIGTGEGAQAYGHGLYFAEAPGVAQSYADILPKNAAFDGKPIYEIDTNTMGRRQTMVTAYTHQSNPSGVGGRGTYTPKGIEDEYPGPIAAYKDLLAKGFVPKNAPKWIDPVSGNIEVSSQGANLYKVDIPDDQIAKMLDWDKTWDQQPKNVQNSINTKALEKFYNTKELPTSQVLYHVNQGRSPAESAEHFRSLGIPGIRYLDAGSRSGGAGTSNFVVFPGNENMMTILERNGQAMSPESQAIARYREIKGAKSVVRMEAALRTAGVPLPKNEPVAYIQSLVDRAHRRN